MNSESQTQEQTQPQPQQQEIKLVNIPIVDENVALNVLVSFIGLAQRRGAFAIDESSKIWECIQKFQRKNPEA